MRKIKAKFVTLSKKEQHLIQQAIRSSSYSLSNPAQKNAIRKLDNIIAAALGEEQYW